jgi:hypothetical protein
MPEAKLTAEEVDALRTALGALAVRRRTGALGVLHAGRFVEAGHLRLPKSERDALDRVARKLGLPNGLLQSDD